MDSLTRDLAAIEMGSLGGGVGGGSSFMGKKSSSPTKAHLSGASGRRRDGNIVPSNNGSSNSNSNSNLNIGKMSPTRGRASSVLGMAGSKASAGLGHGVSSGHSSISGTKGGGGGVGGGLDLDAVDALLSTGLLDKFKPTAAANGGGGVGAQKAGPGATKAPPGADHHLPPLGSKGLLPLASGLTNFGNTRSRGY
jgi:hypothetical protein